MRDDMVYYRAQSHEVVDNRNNAIYYHAYYRCSTATNRDGDTWNRQRTTVRGWAKRAGYKIETETKEVFTGTEEDRPGLTDLIAACEPGAVIVVADASRLSRELSCQMALLAKFNQLGIECIDASSGRSLTDSDDPMMEALTQMQGVFAQLEKRTLVAKLKSGRDAKSRELGRRCEGRNRMYYDVDGQPGNDHGLMDTVKKLRRKPRGKKRMTWNQVSLQLFDLGYKNSNGEPIDRRSLAPKFREFIK